MKIEDKIKQER